MPLLFRFANCCNEYQREKPVIIDLQAFTLKRISLLEPLCSVMRTGQDSTPSLLSRDRAKAAPKNKKVTSFPI